jgi:hypothetical protein
LYAGPDFLARQTVHLSLHRLVLPLLGTPETSMTAKKKAAPLRKPKQEDPKALNVAQQPTETPADALAHTSLRPTVQAALTLMDYNKSFGELSINTLVDDLGKQCELASGGDLKRAEAILTAQAHTLDALFNSLARRAAMNMGEYINAAETYMRLALKAQAQCRATLETLAEIKNPQPFAFVRQANIAHGPQQVNNSGAADPSRAGESENQPNKVLEHQHGERLDFGTAGAAGGADSELETVGAVNRPQDRSG